MTEGRFCYYIVIGQYDEDGYIPSCIREGEPGHFPMTGGNHRFAVPWHWGKTYEEAVEVCRKKNADMGLTEEDVNEIVASSMFAQKKGGK